MMIKISVYFRKSLTPSCASVPVLVMQLADLIGLHHQLLLQLVSGQRVLQQLDLQPGRLVQDLESHTHTHIYTLLTSPFAKPSLIPSTVLFLCCEVSHLRSIKNILSDWLR